MSAFTLQELQCFDAVVRAGGFEAAARILHRSHPAVFAAVAKLERQIGLPLLDRRGYRVRPTGAGQALQSRAQALLQESRNLQAYAAQLAMGEESDLRVVVGDLCPRRETLGLLSRFFAGAPHTRLSLYYEAVAGPVERLLDDEADLIVHWVERSDARIEWQDLCEVSFVPVVAPGFLPQRLAGPLTPARMREFTQCVLRDTARHSVPSNYFTLEGAHRCTVADQLMKKEVIMQGMAWGHLPRFLIEAELKSGALQSIAGRHLPGRVDQLVAARRSDRPHGPVATRLWEYIRMHARSLRVAPRTTRGPGRRRLG